MSRKNAMLASSPSLPSVAELRTLIASTAVSTRPGLPFGIADLDRHMAGGGVATDGVHEVAGASRAGRTMLPRRPSQPMKWALQVNRRAFRFIWKFERPRVGKATKRVARQPLGATDFIQAAGEQN